MGLKILTTGSRHGQTITVVNGIYCDNVTGAVVAIDLHNPDQLRSMQSKLSGEIRPSLMKLKSLRSLDLSFNAFKAIPIPK
ncbi:LRR receptor-like serine/threonine-protein kinase FLS2-like, partial [Trifolium medium]|nr:LRR receptor-like serine/threonine-protein kinase FLS2-like [Trifolium medium]